MNKLKEMKMSYVQRLGIGLLASVMLYGAYTKFEGDVTKYLRTPKQDEIFLHKDYQKYQVSYELKNMSNPFQKDVAIAAYDINNNGIPETFALYKLKGYNSLTNKYLSEDYARIVVIDEDEDGTPEYILLDMDNDKTLDTRKEVKLEDRLERL